jgi:hypothetical protein
MQTVQLTLYTMENSSSFKGDPTPTVDRLTTTAFPGCDALPEVCKLKLAHHLLSLSVLWQHLSSKETRPALNSKLVTLLTGQLLVISYPPFSTMTSSRYRVSSTVLKLWITIMLLRKTFPSVCRKVKETWLNLMSAALHCLRFYYK